MKLRVSKGISPRFARSGFTIIEIAIALGVIAFALVAIMGILPLGLTVQRDNRFETIINQDATYWLEAIRDGAQHATIDQDDLTNYVERIEVRTQTGKVDYFFGNQGLGASPPQYISTSDIISILTQPYTGTNVFAYVKAISGSAGEKRSEVSFTYRMEVRIVAIDPVTGAEIPTPVPPALWELRLVMAWPVIGPNGAPPGARKPLVYRTLVNRGLAKNTVGGVDYYQFTP